jgi:hypothetical protein
MDENHQRRYGEGVPSQRADRHHGQRGHVDVAKSRENRDAKAKAPFLNAPPDRFDPARSVRGRRI